MEKQKSAKKGEKSGNPMRRIKIEKITLNIGAGNDQTKLDKGVKLIKNITHMNPVKTVTNKRIPTWGLRPGLPIGCKLTLRGESATKLLARLLEAKDKTLRRSNFDNNGNVCFGLNEYIDIPDVKYDPEIGIIGLQVCVTLERSGFCIKRKKIRSEIGAKHKIKKEESINFMTESFKIKLEE